MWSLTRQQLRRVPLKAGTLAPCDPAGYKAARSTWGRQRPGRLSSLSSPAVVPHRDAATALTALPTNLQLQLPIDCTVSPNTVPVLHQLLERYAARTPKLQTVVDQVMRKGWPGSTLGHDHLAFRTFGVPGLGIASMQPVLQGLGYEMVSDEAPLAFPAKKLVARWFRAQDARARASLPRVFVSELQVERLSAAGQRIVHAYVRPLLESRPEDTQVQVMCALLTGGAPWRTPKYTDYQALLAESEYAAWVLAHGFSVNHTALALHRLPPAGTGADIHDFVARLQAAGLEMNGEGGIVKVSPDKLLLQCAVVADRMPFAFEDQEVEIAAAYVEFVQRLRLPSFAHVPPEEVQEAQLRDGFEVGNADRIFHSTTLAAGAGAR